MTAYFLLKLVHILGAAVLFGTGLGIAFFMAAAHRTGDAASVAATARIVVLADFVFTASAVVIQPLTGLALLHILGLPWTESWVVASIGLYILTGAFWLPVVFMQIRMRDLAAEAASRGEALPKEYHRLFRLWFACGWPAFLAVIAIFWLMLTKPILW